MSLVTLKIESKDPLYSVIPMVNQHDLGSIELQYVGVQGPPSQSWSWNTPTTGTFFGGTGIWEWKFGKVRNVDQWYISLIDPKYQTEIASLWRTYPSPFLGRGPVLELPAPTAGNPNKKKPNPKASLLQPIPPWFPTIQIRVGGNRNPNQTVTTGARGEGDLLNFGWPSPLIQMFFWDA